MQATNPLVIIPLCRKGDRAGIEKQLQAGATINEKDVEGNTPLHVAVEASKNEIATVQCLLENGASPNACNAIGAVPLHYVCLRKTNHRSIANILLENGAQIDDQTFSGRTALSFACEHQVPELVEILCIFGANPNIVDKDGNAPIHHVLLQMKGRDTVKKQIVEHLLANKSAFHSYNVEGFTPLHLACRAGCNRCVQFLIEQQADIQALTSKQETNLHLACRGGFADISHLFIQLAPAFVDSVDMDGNTPLHMCAMTGHLDCALLLLKLNAKTNLKNGEQKTAVDLARIHGTDLNCTHNPELMEVLADATKGGICRQS